jgi:hypothetical protein
VSDTGKFGGMQINTPKITIHSVEKTLANMPIPNRSRLKYRRGRMSRPRMSRMLCGTV